MLIFHVDTNSAYLSWTAAALLERGYGQDIRDVCSAIAGDPDNRHGIILAKSIPAKKMGVKTGDTILDARRKCPGLVLYPPDYDLFILASDAMYDILARYTPVIQRYSIDECFMDLTSVRRAREDPVALAYEIKDTIKEELGFTVNIGIGENKLCAKMAGELKKPDMVHTMWPPEIPSKLWPLPVEELFMVGRASRRKLHEVNIRTIGELAAADEVMLRSMMKSHGALIHAYARGIDDSPVVINSDIEQKGVGNSMTFSYDVEDRQELYMKALSICERTGMRLRKLGRRASIVSVHLKYGDFRGFSHQLKLHSLIESTTEIYETVKRLIDESWKGEPVRQFGVSLSGLVSGEEVQLSMFDSASREKLEKLAGAVDDIRAAYGNESIVRGCFVNSGIRPLEGGVNDGNYINMGGYR